MTGDEPQGTMGRVIPSRLPLRAHFHQKRDVWVRGQSCRTCELHFFRFRTRTDKKTSSFTDSCFFFAYQTVRMHTESVAERFESILLDGLSFNCIFPAKFDFDRYLTVTGKENSIREVPEAQRGKPLYTGCLNTRLLSKT